MSWSPAVPKLWIARSGVYQVRPGSSSSSRNLDDLGPSNVPSVGTQKPIDEPISLISRLCHSAGRNTCAVELHSVNPRVGRVVR